MRPLPSTSSLVNGVLSGDRALLSRAITLVESPRPGDRSLVRELFEGLRDRQATAPQSVRIGITGSPGVGKSTFIEAYGTSLLEAGHRLAVLAIDPSSSRSRGSILGDKTRMPILSQDLRAFVRPSPAGQTLGGLSAGTRRAVALCEAAGYDRVLVETVGVGQSEHAVHGLTDLMILLMLPGGGDDLQGIKRGIVELADLIVVTKADGDTLRLAQRTAQDYRQAVHLQPARADGWTPQVITASSVTPGGLQGFGESLQAYLAQLGPDGILARRRAQRLVGFDAAWPEVLAKALRQNPDYAALLQQIRLRVQSSDLDLELGAESFVDAITSKLSFP